MQPFHRLRYTSGFAAVIAVTCVAAACSNLVPLSRVAAAEAKWTASRIQNYRYTFEIGSLMPFTECSPRRRIEVEVRNGQTVTFGTCSPDAKLAQAFGSVPGLFATIREERSERPPRYLVRFDSALGYPQHIDANYSREMTDHDFRYDVEDFRATP